MRISVDGAGAQAHQLDEFGHAKTHGKPRAQPVHPDRFGNQIADRLARVERGIGVLEHHLHLAAQLAQLVMVGAGDILAFEPHLARRRLGQPQDRATGRGLATAALADQAEGFATADIEADAVDRLDGFRAGSQKQAAPHSEVDLEVLDAQDVVAGPGRGHVNGRRHRVHATPSNSAGACLCLRCDSAGSRVGGVSGPISKWQAARWRAPTSRSTGASRSHLPSTA